MPISGAKIDTVGIIAANMDGVGTFDVAKVLKEKSIMTAIHKMYSEEDLIKFFNSTDSSLSFYSMGISDNDYNKFMRVKNKAPIDMVCIDVANGYMSAFYDYIKRIRDENPAITIMAGNVVTPEAVEMLYESGVDIAKLGIGPGAMCTTRIMTGIGYPQLSCIMDSIKMADDLGIFLCSDGGCTVPGDVSIAISAGADFVMLGTMLAGTDEGGSTDIVDGKVLFYGMSSKTANEKHFGGLKDYRSSEGRTALIPYKGPMNDVIQHILGGLSSTCAYVGAKELQQLPLRSNFIRVNNTHNTSFEKFTIGN
jgi:GMP reductase